MEDTQKDLAAPFDPYYVKWKAQSTKGDRALAVAYIDARAVMDRLDSAVGPGKWQDTYQETNLGVVCSLSLFIDGQWVKKEDIGQTSGSEFTDPGKTGYSDAFKRVAVKWGIGRYLYRLPAKWVDYDQSRKRLTETPELPKWAMPHSSHKTTGPDIGQDTSTAKRKPPQAKKPQPVGKDPTEIIKQGKAAMAQDDDSPHWITDTGTNKKYHAWLNGHGWTAATAKEALKVESMKDYDGSIGDAFTALTEAGA